jgi:hypothetical protein
MVVAGTRRPDEGRDVEKTALIVIDAQQEHFAPVGFLAEVKTSDEVAW